MDYRAGLANALDALEAAEAARDEQEIWEKTCDVLGWLYRYEEARRASDSQYYANRSASADGQTLAGLIWVRGLVEHHQAEVRATLFKPAQVKVAAEGEWKPATVKVGTPDGWKDAAISVAVAEWPQRSILPTGKPETHGRDVMYDQHVAGEPLLPPLRAAQRFLN